ncbi:hypothetical protein BKA70DRAFT_1315049 [Coprinopsis sp. MPI-PUGE-AT-0042]|nr:hypothetical protein BKA70DRAFT_1315049 [Coprinopsis sp. MPI-PUGE-AT-0042]
MEGVVEHVYSEGDDLRLKLQASEDALLQFKAEAEVANRLAKVWEEDKQRLINDLRVQKEELELVRERFRMVQQNRSANREESTKDQISLPQMTLRASSGSKPPLDDDHSEAPTSEPPKLLELKAEAELARALARNWEEDNKSLREDLRASREENKSLRERIGILEETPKADWDKLGERLMVHPKEPHSLTPSTLDPSLSSKRPCDDEGHPDQSSCKRLRMTVEPSQRCTGDEEAKVAQFGEKKDGLSVTGTIEVLDSLAECLSCTPLEISPAPSLRKVSTAFIQATYEATPHHSVHLIPAHKNPTGGGQLERRIAWPTSTKNPLMPRLPGQSGLLYLATHEPIPEGPLSLAFATPRANNVSERAAYTGEYEVRDMGQMSAEWFTAQGHVMKTNWAEWCLVNSSDYNIQLRARIARRKHGVIDREMAPDTDLKVETELEAVNAGGGYAVTVKDIIHAFIRGDELPPIRIVQVACVGYDHIFANDMQAKYKKHLRAASRVSRLAKDADDKEEGVETSAIVTNGEGSTTWKKTRRGTRGGKGREGTVNAEENGAATTATPSGATAANVPDVLEEGEAEDGEIEE